MHYQQLVKILNCISYNSSLNLNKNKLIFLNIGTFRSCISSHYTGLRHKEIDTEMSGKTEELMPRGHKEVVKAECDNVRFVTVLVLFDNGRDLLVVSNQREEILNMNKDSSYYRR